MLVPLVLLAMFAQSPPYVDPVDRGAELLRQCQSAIRIEATKGRVAAASESRAAADCTAYISGFNDGVVEAAATRKSYCLNRQATTRMIVHLYVAFMQKNREWLNYDKSVGLTLALQNAYPCAAPDPDPSPVELDPD